MKKYQFNKKTPIYLFIVLIVLVAFLVIITSDESSKRGNDMPRSVYNKVAEEPITTKPIIEKANGGVKIVIAERYENTNVIYASLSLDRNQDLNSIYLASSKDIIVSGCDRDYSFNTIHLRIERKDGSCNFTEDDKITVHSLDGSILCEVNLVS